MDAAAVAALVERVVADVAADGVAISVATGPTAVAWCRGRTGDAAVGASSVMYAASVTKQLVGYLAALAVGEGRLDPEASIVELLPSLPAQLAPVRVRHLVHHTCDLPDVVEAAPGPPLDNGEAMARLRGVRPCAPVPGMRYAYSNTGYVVLAEVLQVAFAVPIGRLAQERIFDPLGMANSRLGGPPVTVTGWPDPPGTVGDGGLWTTAADLVVWLSSLNRRLLDRDATLRAETRGALDDGTPLDYAWGVRVTGPSNRPLVTHGGSWGGWLAKTVRDPVSDVSVAVLSWGSDETAISGLGLQLAERVRAERSSAS